MWFQLTRFTTVPLKALSDQVWFQKNDGIFHIFDQIKVSRIPLQIVAWRVTWNYVYSPFKFVESWNYHLYINNQTFLITLKRVWLIPMYLLFLSVCLFVTNKRQNGWTDRARGKVYGRLKFQNCLQKNSIVIKFWKATKFFY